MNNQNNSVNNFPKWLAWFFLILSLVGFMDAAYLAIEHYRGLAVACSAFGGKCDIVISSQYASVAHVPVALVGAIYYLVIFAGIVFYLWTSKKPTGESNKEFIASAAQYIGLTPAIMNFIPRFTILGFLASLWFVYLQLFVLRAICIYCMGSALTSTILFILGLYAIKLQRSEETA